MPGHLHHRTRLRYEITYSLLERESIPWRALEGRGESALSQMLSTILLGDYVSYYLALLQRVDPSPVSVIDYIKERLADPA
jgi:glucose/mannose-6-phosphate isomerase